MTRRVFELPSHLAAAVGQQRDPGFAPWVERLPVVVPEVAGRWELRLGPPFQPGGVASWTAPATDPAGRDLVLKVGWTHDEGRDEAAGLRLWGGRGAVRLHDSWVDGETTALLLERARPGVELGQALPEEQQDEVIGKILRRTWVRPAEPHPFRSLAQMCAWWADSAARTPPDAIDRAVFDHGLALFRSLPQHSDDDVLLVTDLHAGNVLSAEREPWLLIDPKPYVGDRHYDPLQHLVNCQDRLAADPFGLTDRIARLCALDVSRLRTWVFARWCVEAAWAQPHELTPLVSVISAFAPS